MGRARFVGTGRNGAEGILAHLPIYSAKRSLRLYFRKEQHSGLKLFTAPKYWEYCAIANSCMMLKGAQIELCALLGNRVSNCQNSPKK
jgi:hypothetical protein